MIETYRNGYWINQAGGIADFNPRENNISHAKMSPISRRDKAILLSAGAIGIASAGSLVADNGWNHLNDSFSSGHAWDIFKGNFQAPFEYYVPHVSHYTTITDIPTICAGSSITALGSHETVASPMTLGCAQVPELGKHIDHAVTHFSIATLPVWQEVSTIVGLAALGAIILSPLYARGGIKGLFANTKK